MQAAWERLSLALGELTSSAPIKQRLVSAFSTHFQGVDPDTLPGSIRGDFRELAGRLSVVPPSPGESSINATIRKMSNQDAEACCALIVRMLVTLHREALAAAGPAAEVVPLRAAEA
jgi:hypothetical protein